MCQGGRPKHDGKSDRTEKRYPGAPNSPHHSYFRSDPRFHATGDLHSRYRGKVVRINRGIERIQGERLPEITGRSPGVLFQDPTAFEKLLARVSASDVGQVEKTDVNLMNSAGESYLADVNLVRLLDAGKLVGYLLVIEDTTRKKAFSDKIIQSEKLAALGTMAGGVSHDFNNLLMAILGHIQLILPRIEDEEIRRRLQNIEKAVYDGSNTVRRLQRFTERERDPKAAASTIDIEEAVKDVVELTRPRWKNLMESPAVP